jgi:L-fuculose-phosphate aldolase
MNNSKISLIVRRAVMECLSSSTSDHASEEPMELFHSPVANAIKKEIVRAGRKLWERQYVDGNGGNISARISPKYVICTPTLRSKGDLEVEDLSLVDLENNQICGDSPQTSEILLHLEIYKATSKAKAVIHCHPPYATAHAIAGVIPQGNLVPEQEVFIGPVVLTPYETPGTGAFAKTIVPVVRQHNTILLANHGVVCWADTVTHAEWYVEVIDTYCKTVMIASQLKSPLVEIPPDKIRDLLEIKKKLGLPDARLPLDHELAPDTMMEMVSVLTASMASGEYAQMSQEEIDRLVSSLTTQIMGFLEKSA